MKMHYDDIIKDLPNLIKDSQTDILRVLFAHKDWMPTFSDETDFETRVIIDGVNLLTEEDKKAIVESYEKWTTHVTSLYNNSKINETNLKTPTVTNNSTVNAGQLPVYLPTDELVKGIAANLLYHCLAKYAGQNSLFDDTLIQKLSHHDLPLIKPWIQVGFCKHCNHFDLLFSSNSKKYEHCRDCNMEIPRIRIYKVDEKFASYKQKHKDLPTFIESYILKHKPNAKTHLSYKLKDSTNQDAGDIDVLLPSTKTGIECKIFGSHQTPQGDTLSNYSTAIENSLRKYLASGEIERIVVITNLSEYTAKQIENNLLKKFKQEGFNIKHLQIGYFSLENLFAILKQEILLIN